MCPVLRCCCSLSSHIFLSLVLVFSLFTYIFKLTVIYTLLLFYVFIWNARKSSKLSDQSSQVFFKLCYFDKKLISSYSSVQSLPRILIKCCLVAAILLLDLLIAYFAYSFHNSVLSLRLVLAVTCWAHSFRLEMLWLLVQIFYCFPKLYLLIHVAFYLCLQILSDFKFVYS